ncbi:MAG TPA: excinuclease ABC subunit UvrC [Firmicutes bacterium]|nr:excinuclease ABC subunit UvrC [Bacillota bacterium]
MPPDLPDSSGVYIFRDKAGKVIYVGKAVSLRNRVRSYFQEANFKLPKVRQIVSNAESLEFIITASEVEALILENNLIKQHRPKYNVRLRDDKNYPYLRITLEEEWPRVVVARRMKRDGSRYFGPYTRSGAVRDTLRLIRRLFPYRTCSDSVLRNSKRPCLNYHIKRCLGPCAGKVSREEYMAMIQGLMRFLEGHQNELRKELVEKMQAYSTQLNFERAAEIRDLLRSIDEVMEKQHVVSSRLGDVDIIGIWKIEPEACASILQVRDGKLVGREQLFLTGIAGESTEELVASVLKLYYPAASSVPPEIVVPKLPAQEDLPGILEYIPAKLSTASRGLRAQLLRMAEENARSGMEQARPRQERLQAGLSELQRLLGLKHLPRRIEAFDISNIQGKYAVASMVVFVDGMPSKADYRKFRIATPGPDDYAMMYEALKRRLKYLTQASAASDRPDLIVVDGGPGQLAAGLRAQEEMGIEIPTIALAKREELIYAEDCNEPLRLPGDSTALQVLQSLRDEAHRFAVKYHRTLRRNDAVASLLEEIPGIGPKRRAALLKRFGSLEGLRAASIQEICSVQGMTRKLAEQLKEHFG